jgi:uncharacterized membrane protein YphA (DoxX/SURF4 family)
MDRAATPTLESIYRPLWLTFGLVPLLAGLDKFFNLLADWPSYLSPVAADVLPVPPQSFLYLVGVVEMLVGLLVLTRWTRIGAWIAAAWLVLIAGNLVLLGALDVAVRDLGLAVGAYTLARLAEARAEAPAGAPVHTLARGAA